MPLLQHDWIRTFRRVPHKSSDLILEAIALPINCIPRARKHLTPTLQVHLVGRLPSLSLRKPIVLRFNFEMRRWSLLINVELIMRVALSDSSR